MILAVSRYLRVRVLVGFLVLPAMAMASEYYQEAQTFYRNGELKAAVIQLKNLLDQEPDHADGRVLMGRIHLENDNYAAAEKELQHAIRLGKYERPVALYLGKALIGLGRYEDALIWLTNDLLEGEDDPQQRWSAIGQAQLNLKALDEAESAFRQSLSASPSGTAQLGLAMVTWSKGDLDRALTLLGALGGDEDAVTKGMLLRAEILLSQARGEEALEAFTQFLGRVPEHKSAHYGRARAAIIADQVDLAAADAEWLLVATPEEPEVLQLAAVIELERGNYPKAKQYADQLLIRTQEDLQSLMLAATANFFAGELQDAKAQVQAVLGEIPGDSRALRLKASVLLAQKHPEEALEAIKPLLKRGEGDRETLAIAGRAYLQLGNWEAGEKLLNQSLDLSPQDSATINKIAAGRLMRGQEGEALSFLDRHTGPADLRSDSIRIAALVRQGKIDGARKLLASRIEKAGQDVTYHLMSAIFEQQFGSVVAARRAFEMALDIDGDHPGVLVGLANLDLREGALSDARARYQRVLKNNPKHLVAMLGIARVAQLSNDPSEAAKWLNNARDLYPDNAPSARAIVEFYSQDGRSTEKALAEAQQFYLGREDLEEAVILFASTQRFAGDLSGAEAVLSRYLRAHPDNLQVMLLKAEVLRDQRRFGAALDISTRLIKQAPDKDRAALLHAELLTEADRAAEARDLLIPLWKKAPSFEVAQLLGVVEYQLRNLAGAREYLKFAYDKRQNPRLMQMIVQISRQLGGWEDAALFLQAQMEREPRDFVAQLQLASVYQQMNQMEKAVDAYRVALELDPKAPLAWNNLAWLVHGNGDSRSLEYARNAYDLAPESPDIQDTLGWMLLDQGFKSEGLELLEQAAGRAPKNSEIRFHYATALVKNDRFSEARPILDELAGGDSAMKARAQALLKRLE